MGSRKKAEREGWGLFASDALDSDLFSDSTLDPVLVRGVENLQAPAPPPPTAGEQLFSMDRNIGGGLEAEALNWPTPSPAHNFWTNPRNKYDPKAQYRFIVRIPGMALEDSRPEPGDSFADEQDESGGNIWWAKSIDKPGFSIVDLQEDYWYNSVRKAAPLPAPTRPKFKKVSMTLIDPVYPNTTRKLLRYLRRGGFQEQQAFDIANSRGGPVKSYINTNQGADQTMGNNVIAGIDLNGEARVEIDQLDAQGKVIETWTLIDAYPAEVDFGKLDYSSDDLVEITVTWAYKTFTCGFPGIGNELAYEYFRDHNKTLTVKPKDRAALIAQYKAAVAADPTIEDDYANAEAYIAAMGRN